MAACPSSSRWPNSGNRHEGSQDLDRAANVRAVHPAAEMPVPGTGLLLLFALLPKQPPPCAVGFWHAKFVSEGTTGIPDGTIIDMGFSQWHSDGTEILNSSRAPATSNFCLGVWEKTGNHTYKLNHFALSSDLHGKLIGPANIREEVTLDASGNSYTGKFTIDQFDLNGNTLAHVAGNISATRITIDTTIGDIL